MDSGIRHPQEGGTTREPEASGPTDPASAGGDPTPAVGDPTPGGGDPDRRFALVASLLLAIVAAGLVDLALDRPRGLDLHVLVEAGLILLSLGTAIYLWRGWARARRSLALAEERLRARGAERDAWRARAEELLRGLGDAIDEQLREWDLTPAERETALLLLEGHSHKRIARQTGRSDRTVRQHAVAVYRKSGLAGRAELAGFFLGGLAPGDGASGRRGTRATEARRDAER